MSAAQKATHQGRPSVIWDEVECGAYEADLPLWQELAQVNPGPVLELGCGGGRVALHLARHGHRVTGVEIDSDLVAELRRRAAERGLPVEAVRGDATRLSLDQRFGLVLAPMQLIQLLPGPIARRRCLRAAAAHLRAEGQVALAIVEQAATGIPATPQLPDVRERDGWVYSSLPLGVVREGDALVVERLRQSVDPAGHLEESRNTVRLQVLSAAELEGEARSVGLRPTGRRRIEADQTHVGATIVVLES
jgi:SAM-dependent methyltransferase